jgi:hypothetical protein
MKVGPAHHTWRELDRVHVEAGFPGVAFDDGGLEAKPIRLVDPFELIRCDSNDALRRFLSEGYA